VVSKHFFFLLIIFVLGAGCNVQIDKPMTETPAVGMITSTLPVTITLALADTLTPPPAQPTPAPIEGTTSSQVNVRLEPSTSSNVLGIIPANTKVKITGKDPAGNWWQILYPQGKDGKGWVTAQYVMTGNAAQIPVIGAGSEIDPNSGKVAIIQQQINVRSGPGTSFNSLGTLNAKDVVRLMGKDSNSAWLQIEFPSGPNAKGWVNAAFVQAKGVENLPIVAESGETIGTSTPTGIPFTPTPTIVPARMDNDSQVHPIASVAFEPLGTQSVIYTGDVSTPEGDAQDWVQFTSYTDTVYSSLECWGSANLQVKILEDGQGSSLSLACGQHLKALSVKPGSIYDIQLQASQSPEKLQYNSYTITIQTNP